MTKKIDEIINEMRRNPKGIRFRDLCRVCDHYFGEPRQQSGSHRNYHSKIQIISRISIQNDNGMAKFYQVKQVLEAIDVLEKMNKE